MHIVCPHCTTSYAIDLATLGNAGRTVRCSRCKEVWLARPADATAVRARVPAMAGAERRQAARVDVLAWNARAGEDDGRQTAVVDSPPISPASPVPAHSDAQPQAAEPGLPSAAPEDASAAAAARRQPWFGKLANPPSIHRAAPKPFASLSTACAAMGALVLALVIWRVDVVRLLPQTAMFYDMVGLEVNLRGLRFKDVKISSETAEGKPVLVIEGMIVGEARKPVELPRLRFSVRDAQGAEIYAWNAVLEQPLLKPGEKAWFKSRLASPPPEGRNIDVRFFSKRDIAGGNA